MAVSASVDPWDNYRLLIINVGAILLPVPELLSLDGKAGGWWWHIPCSREVAWLCWRLVTEGHERGHFDHLRFGPSMSPCANEQHPYSGKSGL